MKICRNCITEIPNNVNRCPNCGKDPNKEKNYIPLMAILSIILFVGIGITTIVIISEQNFKFDFSTSEKNNGTVNETKGSIFKGEKTITCSKETTDEDGTNTKEKQIFITKNDIIRKVEQNQIITYSDDSGSIAYGFLKLFVDELDQIDGFETSISEYQNNSFTYTMKLNYDELNINKLKELFGDNFDEKTYNNNLKFSDYQKNNLEGYTCK